MPVQKKYRPAITMAEFDAGAADLKAALRKKYDASKADEDRPALGPATAGAFGHVPDLDSKTVARWSSTVRDHIGCKLDPRLIRRGGYSSFEDFWSEMSPRLRASCLDGPVSDQTRDEVGVSA